MLVSILHRATGIAMALGAASLFVWWLVAAASGPQAYEVFHAIATSWLGYVVAIGFTWTFLQHMFTGIRHLVLDTGAGYELHANRLWSIATLVGSISLTALIWALILVRP